MKDVAIVKLSLKGFNCILSLKSALICFYRNRLLKRVQIVVLEQKRTWLAGACFTFNLWVLTRNDFFLYLHSPVCSTERISLSNLNKGFCSHLIYTQSNFELSDKLIVELQNNNTKYTDLIFTIKLLKVQNATKMDRFAKPCLNNCHFSSFCDDLHKTLEMLCPWFLTRVNKSRPLISGLL